MIAVDDFFIVWCETDTYWVLRKLGTSEIVRVPKAPA